MDIDRQRLSRYAPLGLPLAVIAAGWMLLVQPRINDNARVAKEIDELRQQLARVRSAISTPLPATSADESLARFDRQTAAFDPTPDLLEQLARLAATARVANLLIETGERVSFAADGGPGPQVVGANTADPRFALFTTPLAYSPVTISFDAEYAQAGTLLWSLRDLATTVEVRDFEARPVAEAGTVGTKRSGKIHVILTLFAYVRQGRVASAGGSGVLR
jgi:Tfp pilus assembly protein PilO